MSPPLFARQVAGTFRNGGGDRATVHEGDLRVAGPWSPPASPFIVTGDLLVDGSLITCAADRDADLLVAMGAVRCRDLMAVPESTTFCGGPLEVEGLLFAAARDVIVHAYGPLRARYLISGAGTGWLSSFHDDVSVDGYFDYFADGRTTKAHAAMQTQPRVDLRQEVVPELLDLSEWECMSEEERAAELESGETPFSYASFDERGAERRFRAGEALIPTNAA